MHKGMRKWVRGAAVVATATSLLMVDTPARATDTKETENQKMIKRLGTVADIAGTVSNIYGAFQAAEAVAQLLGLLQTNDMSSEFSALHSQIDQVAGNVSWFIQETDREDDIASMQNLIRGAIDQYNSGIDLSPGSNAGSALNEATLALVGRAMSPSAFQRYDVDSQTDGDPVADYEGSFTWKDLISYSRDDLQYQDGYVYDWREGVPAFMQMVALRIQAMGMEDPNFIQNGTFYTELMGYHDFLVNQYFTMYDAVRCNIQERSPVFDGYGNLIYDNYRYLISCADIFSGLNETTELVFGDGLPVGYAPCQNGYNDNGQPTYDQSCLDQRNADYPGWYQTYVQPVADQAVIDVWNMEPWYQMVAMIDTLYHYANDTTDPTQGSTHAIKLSANTGLCMRAQANGTDPGTIAELHNCFSTDSERWRYDRYSETLVNVNSGLCLDVQWGSSAPATPVWTWDCNGGPAQRWTYDTEDGFFWNALGGVLTVANWDLESGVPLVTWYPDGSSAERWQ